MGFVLLSTENLDLCFQLVKSYQFTNPSARTYLLNIVQLLTSIINIGLIRAVVVDYIRLYKCY